MPHHDILASSVVQEVHRGTRDYRIPERKRDAGLSFSLPILFNFQSSGGRSAVAMVFIGWDEGKRTMVPVDKIPSWLLKPQDSPGFVRQGVEKFEGWLRIQHTHPEWHEVKLAMFRWEFTIHGDTWTIYKHANDYE